MGFDNTLSLSIAITASDKASSVISSVIDKISGGSGLVKALAGAALATATLGIGLGVTAVQSASAFNESLDQLVAHAGLAANQVNTVSASLLQMGPAVGQMPDALAQAIYPILSGFSGITNASDKAQLSLTELRLAGESVAGTTTNIGDVTSAATATFNAFGMQSKDNATNIREMNSLFDEMNLTITLGNQKWSDFSNVAGKLAVSAKAAHLSLDEAYASEATLTNEGYSARLATTYLSNTFNELEIKTASMAKHAAALGISFNITKFATMDLGDQIRYLNRITGGNQSDLLGIFGGNSVALKTFDALTTGLGSYGSNMQALGNAHGTTASAFGTTSQGFGFKVSQAQAALQSLSITVGSALLPVLTPLMQQLTPLIGQFGTWLQTSGALKDITQGTAGALQFLGGAISSTATVLGTLVSWGVGFYQGIQDGNPLVLTLAASIGTLGSAIALVKIEEWGAGIANAFDKMNTGNGVIANLASKALPELGKQLGWTKTAVQAVEAEVEQIAPKTATATEQAQADIDMLIASFDEASVAAEETGTAIEGVGTEATVAAATAATSSAAITVSMGIATAGISLLVGGLVAALAYAATNGKSAVEQMTASAQEAYNSLGTSAADTAAKQKAASAEVSTDGETQSTSLASHWQASYTSTMKAADQAKAQQILDQQLIADAAINAAKQADQAWVNASNDASVYELMLASGYTSQQAGKYTGTTPYSPSNRPTIGVKTHASGGYIPPGAHILGDTPYPELVMRAGPGGLNVFNPAQTAAMLGHSYTFAQGSIVIQANGGDPTQIAAQLMPAIEREIARRFRVQTNSYAGRGVF